MEGGNADFVVISASQQRKQYKATPGKLRLVVYFVYRINVHIRFFVVRRAGCLGRST